MSPFDFVDCSYFTVWKGRGGGITQGKLAVLDEYELSFGFSLIWVKIKLEEFWEYLSFGGYEVALNGVGV